MSLVHGRHQLLDGDLVSQTATTLLHAAGRLLSAGSVVSHLDSFRLDE